jgi:phospholipase/carboxylesterase
MLPVLQTGAARADAAMAAVMIHGRGRSPEEMAGLGEALKLTRIRYYCPEADGHSWYPGRFLEPIENNQPALDAALLTIASLIEDLNDEGFADERILLCGFSQGACLVAETLMRRPAAYAAALVFTGGLIGPPGTAWRPASPIPQVPVLLTGGELDEWVPSWRTRETAEALAGAGALVETIIYPTRPHEVSQEEILRARALVSGCLSCM